MTPPNINPNENVHPIYFFFSFQLNQRLIRTVPPDVIDNEDIINEVSFYKDSEEEIGSFRGTK